MSTGTIWRDAAYGRCNLDCIQSPEIWFTIHLGQFSPARCGRIQVPSTEPLEDATGTSCKSGMYGTSLRANSRQKFQRRRNGERCSLFLSRFPQKCRVVTPYFTVLTWIPKSARSFERESRVESRAAGESVARNDLSSRTRFLFCAASNCCRVPKYESLFSLKRQVLTCGWASASPQSVRHQPQNLQGHMLHERAKQPSKSKNACRHLGQ